VSHLADFPVMTFSISLVTEDVKAMYPGDQGLGMLQHLPRSPLSIRSIHRGSVVVPGPSG
jgi:hypothetical protein